MKSEQTEKVDRGSETSQSRNAQHGGPELLRAESVSSDLASVNEQIATVGENKACGGALKV